MCDFIIVVVSKQQNMTASSTLNQKTQQIKKSEISANLKMLLQMEKQDAEVGNSSLYKELQHHQTYLYHKNRSHFLDFSEIQQCNRVHSHRLQQRLPLELTC